MLGTQEAAITDWLEHPVPCWTAGLEGPGLGTISPKPVAKPTCILLGFLCVCMCEGGTPPPAEDQCEPVIFFPRHKRMRGARDSSHILSSHAKASDC